MAARYGLTVERRNHPATLANLRLGAVVVGMLVALGILAMTVGLIRAEVRRRAAHAHRDRGHELDAARDHGHDGRCAGRGRRGARDRRCLPRGRGRLSNLTPLPLVDLAVIVFGTPLVAAGAGWLFAGREPAVLARRPIE